MARERKAKRVQEKEGQEVKEKEAILILIGLLYKPKSVSEIAHTRTIHR